MGKMVNQPKWTCQTSCATLVANASAEHGMSSVIVIRKLRRDFLDHARAAVTGSGNLASSFTDGFLVATQRLAYLTSIGLSLFANSNSCLIFITDLSMYIPHSRGRRASCPRYPFQTAVRYIGLDTWGEVSSGSIPYLSHPSRPWLKLLIVYILIRTP